MAKEKLEDLLVWCNWLGKDWKTGAVFNRQYTNSYGSTRVFTGLFGFWGSKNLTNSMDATSQDQTSLQNGLE